ncbi:hypothetical protein KUTeg_018156 [Tegillarca granosa]|uniref:Thioredoxin-like fold domain-containing protein n=1 Tax=Tegillarca granosa TaxID=220873 RepID=A0ABQ9EMU1_TEGGR|nr:hypothetical protein KUTeg_018156 [Tegillarca granosa]
MATWNPEWKKDVVYLHVRPRQFAKHIPNLSPFAMKMETWFRINNIKHEVIDYFGVSSKGQSPFIMINEKEIPDSNFGIDYISDHFGIDPYPGLSKSEKGVARAFLKMIEENLAWTIFWYRYFSERAHSQGIGRHSNEEIYKIGCDDIRAISDYLEDKKSIVPYLEC